jgi:ribosomal-protein-alanine N-acetyltransferase
MIFETPRLIIRKAAASTEDIELFYSLWTDPQVMTPVGFPRGLRITREDIRRKIVSEDETVFDKKLIIVVKAASRAIGECKLGRPGTDGISETDVKILPQFWNHGYGTETKRGLVDYLFRHTDCRIIQATPNRNNLASQKMQEAVGGKRIGEGTFRFSEDQRAFTCDVPYYIYHVYREDWEKRKKHDH